PGSLRERVNRGADMTEIPRIFDHFDIAVAGRQPPQNAQRAVFRGIVDEDMLVAVPPQAAHYRQHPLVQLLDVAFFVVTGTHHADGLHRRPPDTTAGEYAPASRPLSSR